MNDQNSKSRFQDFLARIEQSIEKMTTLEIRTIVGDYTLDSSNQVQSTSPNFQVIESRFNLLLGDITVRVSRDMADPQFDWVRQLHADKEKEGQAIVQNNINTLLSLIGLYKQTQKEQQAAGYTPEVAAAPAGFGATNISSEATIRSIMGSSEPPAGDIAPAQ